MVADSVLAKAYKTKLMAVHPDKNPGNESDAKKKTVFLVNAWGKLKEPTLRRLYDQEMKLKLKVLSGHKRPNPTYKYIHPYTIDISQIGSWELLMITIYMSTHIKVLLQEQIDDLDKKKAAEEKKKQELVTEQELMQRNRELMRRIVLQQQTLQELMQSNMHLYDEAKEKREQRKLYDPHKKKQLKRRRRRMKRSQRKQHVDQVSVFSIPYVPKKPT